ncbi:MAG: maleylacetoacetate isomerase [Rhodospirillales bacterium]|jgi:maleylpyruvate isomerase
MRLHTFFRSSAAYRVRIGLNLKGLAAEMVPVHLRRNEQHSVDFARTNPQHFVPALEDGPAVLTQSLAILEYLEETHPEPPLLPPDPVGRARVRALALAIACDIHPLNNLRVLRYLQKDLALDEPARDAWARHWIEEGFAAIEAMLREGPAGAFCHGDAPTLADVCLVPQVANAHRVTTDLSPYPIIRRIDETCRGLPAFAAAAPGNQPDAE